MPTSRPLATVLACVTLLVAADASADQIQLTSGRQLEGVVVRETDTQVHVQIAWKGYMTLDRDSVVSIKPSDGKERERLLAQWREEYHEDQTRDRERLALEQQQRDRGMVKIKGQWMTREEYALLQEQEQAAESKRREETLRREQLLQQQQILARLKALEEENTRLRQQVAQQPRLVYVPTPYPNPLIVHRPRRDLHRDGQGNLIRIEEDNGQKFFTRSDGVRVNVSEHDGHLAFTDERGMHHDLTRAQRDHDGRGTRLVIQAP